MNDSLKNKTILITGSSRGIGKSTALMLSDAGATIIIHCKENIKAAEQTLSELCPGKHFIVQADLSDVEAIKKLVDEVYQKVGKLDVLVNNVGTHTDLPIATTEFDRWFEIWNHTIATNLSGLAHLSFLVSKKMMKQGGGRIINVSSRGAFRGEPNSLAYGASKAGINSFGQSMAKALAPHGVFVYTVAPGFVETDLTAHTLDGPLGNEIRMQSPFERVAKPKEVAKIILFFASEAPEFMTGCIVDINGASYLRT